MLTSETEVKATIDWYSYTADSPKYHQQSTMKCVELDRGLYGYTNGVKFLDGRIELVNPCQPKMRTHVQYSGSALSYGYEIYHVSPFEIIALEPIKMSVTRIDVALDICPGSINIGELARMTDEGHYLSRSTSAMYISTLGEKGETLYIGAPSSKIRLRIYDKAAEQGTDSEWTRIELQVRGKQANDLRDRLVGAGYGVEIIAPAIRAFCDFPESREYQQVLGRKSDGLSPPKQTETDTRAWLLTTVTTALAREIARDETGTFKASFLTGLSLALDDAKKQIRQV